MTECGGRKGEWGGRREEGREGEGESIWYVSEIRRDERVASQQQHGQPRLLHRLDSDPAHRMPD